MSSSIGQNSLNLLRNVNQVQEVGVRSPPNLSGIRDSLLKAASPKTFSLLDKTKTNTDVSDKAMRDCHSYEGVEGLRRLQKVQANNTFYDPGCGWTYKPSSGINPEVNRGAFGSSSGPLHKEDVLTGSGSRWYWDLEQAEYDITQSICKNITKCDQMKYLGKFADVCGYCKTTGTVIPIVTGVSGLKTERYPKDMNLQCDVKNIIGSPGACPVPVQGFTNQYRSEPKREKVEGFVSLDNLDQCQQSPLTRDCVILSAQMAGCGAQGTLLKALSGGQEQGDYDSILKNKSSYVAYRESANPGITQAVLKDGSVTLGTALEDFGTLLKNVQSPNKKLSAAARDLCLKEGAFDSYNFCSEMSPTTSINATNLKCLQDNWKNGGGTAEGSGYPTLAKWQNKTYKQYLDYTADLAKRINSLGKEINATAITEFIGINSFAEIQSLPKDDSTRGAETVWIDIVDSSLGNQDPIILRCDLKLAKDGGVIPKILSAEQIPGKYRVNSDNIAFTTAFEVRTDTSQNLQFTVTTDDGFMLGRNQNPFENTENKGDDWGSWRYQGATAYRSNNYLIPGSSSSENQKKDPKSIFIFKWFQGAGGAIFDMRMVNNNKVLDQDTSFADRQNIYLTQEPYAPWMKYELCTRPNNGKGNASGFFETRWNGPAAYAYGNNKAIPSFDVEMGSIAFQSKKEVPGSPAKGFISLTSNSWWHTKARFSFTAFKTVTLLVRPYANLSNGSVVSVFHHVNFAGFSIGLNFANYSGNYNWSFWDGNSTVQIKAVPNEWSLVTIQYVGNSTNIHNVNCTIMPLSQANTSNGKKQLLSLLRDRQVTMGSPIVGNAVDNRANSGKLILGGTHASYKDARGVQSWKMQSFTGDIGWIHGFRNFFDTESLLDAEINQSWITRWFRPN